MITIRNLKTLTFSMAVLGMVSGSAAAGALSGVTGAVGGALSGVSSAASGALGGGGSTNGSSTSGSSSGGSSGSSSSSSGGSSGLSGALGGMTTPLDTTLAKVSRSLASVKASVLSPSGVTLAHTDVLHLVDARLNMMTDQQLLSLCLSLGGGGCNGMNRILMTRYLHAYAGTLRHRNLVTICVSIGSCGAPTPTNPVPVPTVKRRFVILHNLPEGDDVLAATDTINSTENVDRRFLIACESMAYYGVSVSQCYGMH